MKIRIRKVFPGRQEYETSTFEVELDPVDLGIPLTVEKEELPQRVVRLRKVMHVLMREAQVTILYHAVADGMITPEEMTRRIELFKQELPEWQIKSRNQLTMPESSPATISTGSEKPG